MLNSGLIFSAGLMLAHRLRRWANIKPPLAQRLVFAGQALTLHWLNDMCSLSALPRRIRIYNILKQKIRHKIKYGYRGFKCLSCKHDRFT